MHPIADRGDINNRNELALAFNLVPNCLRRWEPMIKKSRRLPVVFLLWERKLINFKLNYSRYTGLRIASPHQITQYKEQFIFSHTVVYLNFALPEFALGIKCWQFIYVQSILVCFFLHFLYVFLNWKSYRLYFTLSCLLTFSHTYTAKVDNSGRVFV